MFHLSAYQVVVILLVSFDCNNFQLRRLCSVILLMLPRECFLSCLVFVLFVQFFIGITRFAIILCALPMISRAVFLHCHCMHGQAEKAAKKTEKDKKAELNMGLRDADVRHLYS